MLSHFVSPRVTRALFALTLPSVALATTSGAPTPSLFATQVVQYSQGTGGGTFVASNVLGAPTGQGLSNGSLDVTTLGVGGSLTLGFDVTIADGPGADFSVCENVFTFDGECFAEVAWVEVSTDGVAFARMPNRYAGPSTGLPGFTGPWGTYSGLAGALPVIANAVNGIDARDLPLAGGDGFDLHALANDPLVVGGQVNLSAIHFVRLVDPPHASGLDSAGNVIWDNSGATGSADVDAVCVIQHAGSVVAGEPEVDLSLDAQGFLVLRIEDPDGAADLDTQSIHASFDLVQLGFRAMARRIVPDIAPTANGYVLRSAHPFVGTGYRGVLSVSVRDHAGNLSTDQIALQG